jgi:hypothetical protein
LEKKTVMGVMTVLSSFSDGVTWWRSSSLCAGAWKGEEFRGENGEDLTI